MNSGLSFIETDIDSNISATGTGFRYYYDSTSQILEIADLKVRRKLVSFALSGYGIDNALLFITYLDKACQVKALMYSSHQTTSLPDIINHTKLASILESAAETAGFAHHLKLRHLDKFIAAFKSAFTMQDLIIQRIYADGPHREFFKAELETLSGNTAIGRSTTLNGALSRLAENIMRDLIAIEFGDHSKGSAHTLLRISSRLSLIARLLDDSFQPVHKLIDCGFSLQQHTENKEKPDFSSAEKYSETA